MKAKKVILLVLLGFLIFWLFSDPTGLADSGESLAAQAWDLLIELFEAILDFVRALG